MTSVDPILRLIEETALPHDLKQTLDYSKVLHALMITIPVNHVQLRVMQELLGVRLR